MTRRGASRLAWSLFVFAVAFAVVGTVWGMTRAEVPGISPVRPVDLLWMAAVLSVPFVGAVVASRRSENAVGWILCSIGASTSLGIASQEYAIRALVLDGSLAGGTLAAWLSTWLFTPGFGLFTTLVLLLFPDGKLPSSRWRSVARAGAANVAIATLVSALRPGPIEGLAGTRNPVGIDSLGTALELLSQVTGFLFLVFLVVSVSSLVVRFRRSRGERRQQLKCLTYAASVAATTIVLGAIGEAVGLREKAPEFIGALIVVLAIVTVPAGIGIAILKYHLYDIDRIINKTLVYGAVSVLLALGYAGGVLLAQAVLPVTDDSPAVVAITTLAVVALFRPLRNRVQGFVDRRFYRRRYDAARTIESFGSRLRHETDLDSLSRELLGLVNDTMQPAHASLWLRAEATR